MPYSHVNTTTPESIWWSWWYLCPTFTRLTSSGNFWSLLVVQASPSHPGSPAQSWCAVRLSHWHFGLCHWHQRCWVYCPPPHLFDFIFPRNALGAPCLVLGTVFFFCFLCACFCVWVCVHNVNIRELDWLGHVRLGWVSLRAHIHTYTFSHKRTQSNTHIHVHIQYTYNP